MIGDRRVLGIIPARAGSRGLPAKNVRPLLGRPLVAWTIEAAQNSTLLDQIVVSTDDDAVAEVATAMDCAPPVRRPPELADDKASVIDAIAHVMETIGGRWDYVVLLQPTSPLRRGEDIDAAIRLCDATGAPSVISVSPALKPALFQTTVDDQGCLVPAKYAGSNEAVTLNGAVYVGRPDILLAQRTFQRPGARALIMPPERGWDVDSLFDFVICEALAPYVLGQRTEALNAVRR